MSQEKASSCLEQSRLISPEKGTLYVEGLVQATPVPDLSLEELLNILLAR
jgi:hypothetical protein